MNDTLTIVDHPLVQHKLGLMRDKATSIAEFRQLAREVSLLLAYEITRDLPLCEREVETPLMTAKAKGLAGKKLCLISILRAGNGMLEGMLDLLPSARVGHVGLYRDPETLEAIEYYYKVPKDIDERPVVVVDPMLATGNSAIAALSRIARDRPRSLKFACLLAAPEGVAAMRKTHPNVRIYTAALDERLDRKGYILPGLGDAGDRIYGTK